MYCDFKEGECIYPDGEFHCDLCEIFEEDEEDFIDYDDECFILDDEDEDVVIFFGQEE